MFEPKRKTVLVIDDDDVIRQKFKRMISPHYDVVEAETGKVAKRLIAYTKYDCILLDYHLSDIDGIELIKSINPSNDAPIPIIMITNMDDEKIVVEAMRKGVYDYINKSKLQAESLHTIIAAGIKWAAVERKLKDSQKRLEYLSMYDSLTSLPNRHLFLDRLDQLILTSQRENIEFAVLMMDLNLFKEVNDAFGHAAGDELLTQVGLRLKNLARESDTFARLGGDEFAGILHNMHSMEDACLVAKKINDVIKNPYLINGKNISVSISIGIAFFNGQQVTSKTLLAQADSSMYEAKRKGQGFATHSGKERSTANPSLMIASYLSDGLANNEFYMVYQPQIDLLTGECCGVEALARWNSPLLGDIQPDIFVKIAERSEIIKLFTYTTFEMTFKQSKLWESQHLQLPISINLSARMLEEKDLKQSLVNLINKHKLNTNLLTLEITETALMSSPSDANEVLKSLSDLGIKISIDDFGTGYTSFVHLRHFVLNELKIDKLFIKDLREDGRDSSIVNSFVSLAKGFGIKLIAEGVEDESTLDILRASGCTRAQGYWISRPVEAEKIPIWIDEWNAKLKHTKVCAKEAV